MKFPMTIAYNMADKKVGCVLAQAVCGATLSGGQVTEHFDGNRWELNPANCKLYTLFSRAEFDRALNLTHA